MCARKRQDSRHEPNPCKRAQHIASYLVFFRYVGAGFEQHAHHFSVLCQDGNVEASLLVLWEQALSGSGMAETHAFAVYDTYHACVSVDTRVSRA
jgi:hypothetical protein